MKTEVENNNIDLKTKRQTYATMNSCERVKELLRNTGGEPRDWGIINVSVCNMRVAPSLEAGMATQGLLGMPVHIIKTDFEWLQVETVDGCVAWMHQRFVIRVTRDFLTQWNTEPQLIITKPFTILFSQPKRTSDIVSDAVACNRFKYLGIRGAYFKVLYPDGRIGYVLKHDADTLEHWRAHLRQDTAAFLQTAKSFMGFPYMYGGMSSKGMDNSGFIRTILLMHDVIIPRTVAQMSRKEHHINIDRDFSNIQAGDLMFFGRKASLSKPAEASHVALYLGSKRFIHCLGMVKTASLDTHATDFDPYEFNNMLWAQRVIPYINKIPGVFTTDNCEYYQ